MVFIWKERRGEKARGDGMGELVRGRNALFF